MSITTKTFCKPTKRGFRIWIEGSKLTASGFNWRTTYKRTLKDGRILLQLDPAGTLKTSGRLRKDKEVPIIDISLADIEGFAGGVEVLVTFTAGRIVINRV